jgi:hypothetical protein
LLFIGNKNGVFEQNSPNSLFSYDKQGGPRSDDVTTMRFADAVGVEPNSQSRVVMIGLYSKYSASVAVKSSA